MDPTSVQLPSSPAVEYCIAVNNMFLRLQAAVNDIFLRLQAVRSYKASADNKIKHYKKKDKKGITFKYLEHIGCLLGLQNSSNNCIDMWNGQRPVGGAEARNLKKTVAKILVALFASILKKGNTHVACELIWPAATLTALKSLKPCMIQFSV